MKLQDTLPENVVIGRRTYKINFDFRAVLGMTAILARDDLMDDARIYLALKCVMKHPPKRDGARVLAAIRRLLFQQGKPPDGKRVTDFDQDADYIRAAFMQAYGINLWRDKLHWLEFTALLAGLPEGSRYAEILSIRSRPIPSPTKYNKEERDWLIKAKMRCALEFDEKEAAQNYSDSVKYIFNGLLNMKRGDGHA